MKEKILPIITLIVLITAICVVIFVPKNSVVQATAESINTNSDTNLPSCCCSQPTYDYYASDSSSCCCGGMSGTSSCCGQ